ncbi:MAG: GTPase Era, partial [Oscillospiraceae bacterium]|nr:GTPase Era [Oscillospiraceae bacterium]
MVTIAGRPNVGKSTLTNALVGEKISIVSNKPQTTRNRIFAILNKDDTQIILTDTPGFHRAKNRLGDYMVKCVEESVADVDVIALVVEPIANVGAQEEQLIAKIKATRAPSVLVINKIDTVEKPELLEVIAAYSAKHEFDAIIPVSARKKQGLDELIEEF